jgi:GPH family glycoside/pentoside/hexuronide:cation symporter
MSEPTKITIKEKMPKGYIPAWASRALSMAVNVILLMQVTYFATDFAGISAGLVGVLMLASRLFDGFTDLVVGYIISKTNTKLGKARPYELMIIPLWLLTILMFSTPDFGTTGKAAYIFILYAIINSVCATFLNSTDALYMSRSLANEQHRAKVLAGNAVIIMLLSAVISILLPQLMVNWGPQPGGWTRISLAIGLPMMLIGMGRFIFVKETVVFDARVEEESQNMCLKECLAVLAKNKYAFILAGCVLCCWIFQTITSTVGTYYFRYVIGDLGLMSFIGMTSLLAPFMLLFFPMAMRRFGSMTFIRIGLVVSIIGSVLKFFSGTNIALLVAGNFLAALGVSPIGMMINLFLIECMDYSEWKTGKRIEGYVPALIKFCDKLGTGIASGGVGILMAWTGYNATLEVQNGSALFAISGLYTWIPGIVSIVMLFLTNLYDLDKKTSQIKQDLADRRAAASVDRNNSV